MTSHAMTLHAMTSHAMTLHVTPAPVVLVPETAPFSPEQRAWLSGFLAATLLTSEPSPPPAGVVTDAAQTPTLALADNDDAPWHDPAMPLGERMTLAAQKPLAPRLMAAMAQQDCGQCGYNCADYANALFGKQETRLNLCAPGGKETARMLKELSVEIDAKAGASATPPLTAAAASPAAIGASRETPAIAAFVGRRKLNRADSEKDTWHIDFDLTGSGLDYVVGDSFGVFPKNDPGHVDQIIAMLGAAHTTPLRGRTLRDVLRDEVSLGAAPDSLFELMSYITGGKTRQTARALAQGDDPDGDAANLDVFAALQKFSAARPHPEAFVDALEPMQPRLYSISSSPKAAPGRLSLTVDAVRYKIGKRQRLGIASTWLADRAATGEATKVYIQKAHNFSLPENPQTPVIMVGPGTGVAPFRAFLQERDSTQAPGKNWLFFGHQRMNQDFFYREELDSMRERGVLSRLSLAWSRDGAQKFYVQDRMREVGVSLWQWLAEGAHFYVCGDAKRMAKDVEAALVDIVSQHGVRSTQDAIAFVAALKKAGRYQADVY